MVSIAELTARLGLDATEQSAVMAWTGDGPHVRYTEEEAAELVAAWERDAARFLADRAAVPITAGGWKYHPDVDRDEYAAYSADELRTLEQRRGYDFSAHPARVTG